MTPKNPWWIPPHILGRVPRDVTPGALGVLGLVSFALFFEHYDTSLLNNALKFIAEDLSIEETSLGYFQMMIRLGALPAFFIIPWVDRVGRRRLFLLSIVGLSVGTLLTGLAQNAWQFVIFQMLTRTFVLTASAVAIVIVAEEMPASVRGWGVGMLGAVSSVGHGFGAGLFGAIDLLPYGWRSLYVIGALPLLLLPLFSRNLKETARFSAMHQSQTHHVSWFAPMHHFFSHHPTRALGMTLVAILSAMGHISAISFTGYYVLEYQGWEPYQLSIMVIGAGLIGILGNVAAGRFADRFGRRRVGFTFLLVFPFLTWAFFNSPGWAIPVLWGLLVFALLGANVIIRALSSELFPTSHRGTSTGMLTMMEAIGASGGLFLLGSLQETAGDLVEWLPLITTCTIIAGGVLLMFPETRQQELESTSR